MPSALQVTLARDKRFCIPRGLVGAAETPDSSPNRLQNWSSRRQCSEDNTALFAEFMTTDLVMNDEAPVGAYSVEPRKHGTLHGFRAQLPSWQLAGYGWVHFSLISTLAMALREQWTPSEGASRSGPAPWDICGSGCLITEGGRGEGGYLTKSEPRVSWNVTHPMPRSGRRTVVSGSMTIEINEGRDCSPHKDHISL